MVMVVVHIRHNACLGCVAANECFVSTMSKSKVKSVWLVTRAPLTFLDGRCSYLAILPLQLTTNGVMVSKVKVKALHSICSSLSL